MALMRKSLPVLTVLAAILLFWYAAAVWMNAPWQQTLNKRAGLENVPFTEFVAQTWAQEKPLLPAPHQIVEEVWNATVLEDNPRRSLATHAWITLSATLLGFAFGTLLGIGLAVVIVYNDASDRSLMPWIIASQTVPILAIAPMVVVGLAAGAELTLDVDPGFEHGILLGRGRDPHLLDLRLPVRVVILDADLRVGLQHASVRVFLLPSAERKLIGLD